MSPRAAWRLESLGFNQVYDFVPGKAAWLAMGWPTEGTQADRPTAGDLARTDVPKCCLDDTVTDASRQAESSEYDFCLVVNDRGIFMGRLRANAFTRPGDTPVSAAMEPGSTTVRPSEPLEGLVERMGKRGVEWIVVTDLKGRLIGALIRDDAQRALQAQQSAGQ